MPAAASTVYLIAKYEHETRLENYAMDTLRAIGQWKEPPPRYFELVNQKQTTQKNADYTVNDTIDMFRGKGRLSK